MVIVSGGDFVSVEGGVQGCRRDCTGWWSSGRARAEPANVRASCGGYCVLWDIQADRGKGALWRQFPLYRLSCKAFA